MIHIIFDPINGTPIRDGEMEKFVADIANKVDSARTAHWVEHVSNELLVEYFRLAIKDGKIPHDQIVFEYEGEKLQPTEKGKLTHWPKGFCDRTMMVMANLCRS